MAGFFKKLFNRITGKGAEEAVPESVEQAALPAPEEAAVEIAGSIPEVVPAPAVKSKKAAPKKLVKKTAAKKPEAKKVEARKPEAKKPDLKKADSKKREIKPEPKKAATKKVATKAAKIKKARAPEPARLTPSALRRKGSSLKAADESVVEIDSRVRGNDPLGDHETKDRKSVV